MVFFDGKYIYLVNYEILELKKYMEIGIGDVFFKFVDVIELLISIIGINLILVYICIFVIFFGVMLNIFKKIGI